MSEVFRYMGRYLPILSWLPRYRRRDLAGDGLGALTMWAIIVPESVAYAQIAGVGPQYAFYAAPIALVCYALFGSSRHLVVGATSAAAILSASTVMAVSRTANDLPALSAALAIMTGLILIAAGLFRLGFITNFLAESVLTGFLFGMALVIVVRQVGKLVGSGTGDGNFFERAWYLLTHVGDWSLTTIAFGAAAMVVLVGFEKFIPRVPSALVVLAAGIAASALLDAAGHGVAIAGHIPAAVPTPSIPDVDWHQVIEMIGGSFGLALVVFAESYSISRQLTGRREKAVDADQEMVAMGVSNLGAGLFGGFAVSGSASRSAAVVGAGSRTQLSSLFAAALVLITAAFFTPLFTDLPEAVLGAIVIVALRGFFKVPQMIRYWKLDRPAFTLAATAMLGVMVFDLLPGLVIAVALSLMMYIATTSAPRLARLGWSPAQKRYVDVEFSTAQPPGGALVVRPDAQLFFGNVGRLHEQIREQPGFGTQPVVVLDLEASFELGLDVVVALEELADWLAGADHSLRIVAAHEQTEKALLERGWASHGRVLYRTVEQALSGSSGSPVNEVPG